MSNPNRITIIRERDGRTARAEAFYIEENSPSEDTRFAGWRPGWHFRSYLSPEVLHDAMGPEAMDGPGSSAYDVLADMLDLALEAKKKSPLPEWKPRQDHGWRNAEDKRS